MPYSAALFSHCEKEKRPLCVFIANSIPCMLVTTWVNLSEQWTIEQASLGLWVERSISLGLWVERSVSLGLWVERRGSGTSTNVVRSL